MEKIITVENLALWREIEKRFSVDILPCMGGNYATCKETEKGKILITSPLFNNIKKLATHIIKSHIKKTGRD